MAEERRDRFFVAFVLTVAVDLPTAVGASLILASALMVKRLAETAQVEPDAEVTQGNSPGQQTAGKKIPRRRRGVPRFWRVLFWRGGQAGNFVARCRAVAGSFDFADARRAGAGCDGIGRAGRFAGETADQEKGFDSVRAAFAAAVCADAGGILWSSWASIMFAATWKHRWRGRGRFSTKRKLKKLVDSQPHVA